MEDARPHQNVDSHHLEWPGHPHLPAVSDPGSLIGEADPDEARFCAAGPSRGFRAVILEEGLKVEAGRSPSWL
jgi:hypothetical protein